MGLHCRPSRESELEEAVKSGEPRNLWRVWCRLLSACPGAHNVLRKVRRVSRANPTKAASTRTALPPLRVLRFVRGSSNSFKRHAGRF